MSHDTLQEAAEKKAQQRERKRKPKMRVVGKQVFELKRLIERPRKKSK